MYKLNLFKYLLIFILALTCFAIIPEIGQAQSSNPSLRNINDSINQIKIWVIFTYLISLVSLGISIYLLLWKNNQKQSNQTQPELKQLKQLQSRLTQVEDKLDELRSQLKMEIGNQENFQTEIKNIKYKIEQFEGKIKLIDEKVKLTKNSLVEIYNHEPNRLLPYVIEVKESDITINQRRTGSNVSPVFIKSNRNRGIYWIIEIQGITYLVLKAQLKINEYNFNIVKILFDCHNYRDDYRKFQLIQPAKVISLGDDWELKEKGILKFE